MVERIGRQITDRGTDEFVAFPAIGDCAAVIVEPYAVVSPYLKETVDVRPFGLTAPFKSALVAVTFVAGFVITGTSAGFSVVKVMSDPKTESLTVAPFTRK